MNNDALILLAEDHPVNQKVAVLLLNRFAMKAESVTDGLQALEAAKTGRYSLILMDVMMPDMDGLEATRLIREWETTSGTPRLPIIALTALAMVGDKERCLQAGMDDYITKPIEPEILKRKVQKWLKRRKALSEGNLSTLEEQLDIDKLREDYGEKDLQELIDLFMHVTAASMHDLYLAVAAGNLASTERLAHELKGSSSAIYARPFAESCAHLEEAARNRAEESLTDLFNRVQKAFESLDQAVNNGIAGGDTTSDA